MFRPGKPGAQEAEEDFVASSQGSKASMDVLSDRVENIQSNSLGTPTSDHSTPGSTPGSEARKRPKGYKRQKRRHEEVRVQKAQTYSLLIMPYLLRANFFCNRRSKNVLTLSTRKRTTLVQ